MNDAYPSGRYFKEIAKRKAQGRSAITTISATDGETGVGKTAAFTFFACLFDTSGEGFEARKKATYEPQEFISYWQEDEGLTPGSACGLDEAEQLDARRANQHANVDTGRQFETRRVQELTAFLILPSVAEMDPRIERLHNYWIDVKARGRARIYSAHIHNQSKKVYYNFLQEFCFPNMDGSEQFQEMVKMKAEWNRGHGPKVVPKREVEEMQEEHEKKLEERKASVRNRIISNAYDNGDLTYQEIADMLPEDLAVSPQHVGRIARGKTA